MDFNSPKGLTTDSIITYNFFRQNYICDNIHSRFSNIDIDLVVLKLRFKSLKTLLIHHK